MNEKTEVQVPFFKLLVEKHNYDSLFPISEIEKMDSETLKNKVRTKLWDLRDRETSPILTKVLLPKLFELNDFLSESDAKSVLKDIMALAKGPMISSQKEFFKYLVSSGYSKNINGKDKTIRFIDFQDFSKNTYHAIPEFFIQGNKNCYLDCVIFVNGLPLLFKEDKMFGKYGDALNDITSYTDLKKQDQGCPHFFNFCPLVVASTGVECRMGTITAFQSVSHFAVWKTEKKEVAQNQQDTLAIDFLKPATFLTYIYNYVLFSNKSDVVISAKYHQYYSSESSLEEVAKKPSYAESNGVLHRKHMLIFKHQGNGKTYDQIFFPNRIRKDSTLNRKQVFIQDRSILSTNLIKDIFEFLPGGENLKIATSGKDFSKLLKSPGSEIIVGLFQKARGFEDFKNDSADIIIHFDEAQRSQDGELKSVIKKTLKNAQWVGYTGTPVNQTVIKFGKPQFAYTFRDSEADGGTLGCVYKGVQVSLDELTEQINLDEMEHLDKIPREYRQKLYYDIVNNKNIKQAQSRIDAISKYVVKDFKPFLLTTPLSAMFRASSRIAGHLYRKTLQELVDADPELKALGIKVELVISQEGKENASNIYKKEMEIYSKPERIDQVMYKQFNQVGNPVRILVIVDMGSEGYNVPHVFKVYNDKKNQVKSAHSAFQLAMRGNRVFSWVDKNGILRKKTHCEFVDFANILDTLNAAVKKYADENLEGFDTSIEDISNVKKKLKVKFKELVKYSGSIPKEGSTKAQMNELSKKLNEVTDLIEKLSDDPERGKYTQSKDLKNIFKQLARLRSIHNSQADYAHYKEVYGPQILEIALDNVIVKEINEMVNGIEITSQDNFDKLAILAEIEETAEAQALTLVTTIRRIVKEKSEDDPVGSKKLSERVDEVLKQSQGDWSKVRELAKKLLQETLSVTEEEKSLGLDLRSKVLLNDYKAVLELFQEPMTESRGDEFKSFRKRMKKVVDSTADLKVNIDIRQEVLLELSEEFKDEFDSKKDSKGLMNGKKWNEVRQEILVHLNHMIDGIIRGL